VKLASVTTLMKSLYCQQSSLRRLTILANQIPLEPKELCKARSEVTEVTDVTYKTEDIRECTPSVVKSTFEQG
jgi:hypothetical protein